jgi:CBS domain-containing protein
MPRCKSAEKMKRRNDGVLPVVEGKKPIGVITDRAKERKPSGPRK